MDELAKRFSELAEKYGPNVLDAALGAVRIEGYSTLVTGLTVSVIGGVITYLGYYLWKIEIEDKTDEPIAHAFGFFLGLIGLITITVGLYTFIDPWTWAAFTHPELWLAKKAMRL